MHVVPEIGRVHLANFPEITSARKQVMMAPTATLDESFRFAVGFGVGWESVSSISTSSM
jgi:hypothetical protein